MSWAFIIVLLVILVVAAVLAVPLGVAFAINTDKSPASECRVYWLFGVVTWRGSSSAVVTTGSAKKSYKRSRKLSLMRLRTAFVTEKLVEHLLRFIYALIRQVRNKKFEADLRFGFADPADTGRVYGMLAALLLPAGKRCCRVEPVFHQALFQMRLEAEFQIVPLRVLWVVLTFLFSRPVMTAVWAGRQG